MIVYCRSEMTEASSSHCFLRCFARCFGIERRQHLNGVKTTLEPMQNGFSHLGEDEKTNGKATVVRVCEPNSNGYIKNMGGKTCCILQNSSDEAPYSYEPVPTEKELNNGYPVIDKNATDDFQEVIDTKSENSLIRSNGHEIITANGAVEGITQLSNGDQSEEKDIDTLSLGILKNSKSNSELPAHETSSGSSDGKDCVILGGNNNEGAFEEMKDSVQEPNSIVAGESHVSVERNTEASLAIDKHNLKMVKKGSVIVCNGDVPGSKPEVISKLQGDEKETKILQNGQSDAGEHGISYFKDLVKKQTLNLQDLIQKWESVLCDLPDVNEEVRDEIRSVNGQTHLVISERFMQFKSLVEQSERQANEEQNGTKVITLTDLQGFWDMIFFQVQDVLAKFERLDKVRKNNWNPETLHENDKKTVPKKTTKKPVNARNKRNPKTTNGQSSTVSEEEKARRAAARKRLAEARKRMAAQGRTQSSNGENFIVQ